MTEACGAAADAADAAGGYAVGPVRPAERARVALLARRLLPGAGAPRPEDTRVARDGTGRVVGWIETRRVGDEASVLALGVEPAHRRRGVARALLAAGLAGARTVHLEVRASNLPARRMYARLGFAEAGLRRGYYADGEDAVLLSRTAP